MNEIDQLIKERLEKLPDKVVRAIGSVPWREEIRRISKTNNLDEEKTEAFEVETVLVVLGLESPQNYPENLSTEVELTDEQVISIAQQVGEQIFEPILEAVEKKDEENFVKEDEKVESESADGPVVITTETKEEALKELDRRVEESKASETPVPQIVHTSLPVVEKDEVVHLVPHDAKLDTPQEKPMPEATKTTPIADLKPDKPKPMVNVPRYYPSGKDPYREPAE